MTDAELDDVITRTLEAQRQSVVLLERALAGDAETRSWFRALYAETMQMQRDGTIEGFVQVATALHEKVGLPGSGDDAGAHDA